MTNVLVELQRRQWRQVESWNVKSLRVFCEEKALHLLRHSWSCRSVLKNKQSTLAIAFSCDGHFMASSHLTHEIVVYETRPHLQVLHVLSAHLPTCRSPWCLTFHPSHPPHLLSGCLGGTVSLWDTETGECLCTWSSGISSPINSLVFIPSYPSNFLVAYDTWLCLMQHREGKMETVWSSRTGSLTSKVRLVLHHPDSSKILTAITSHSMSHSGTPMQALNRVRSSYRLQLYTYGVSHGPDLEDSIHGLVCMCARVLGPQSVVFTSRILICTNMVESSQTKLSIYSVLPQNFGQCLYSILLVPQHTSVVSLDLSPFQGFLLVGMSGKKNIFHMRFPVLTSTLKVFEIKQLESSSLTLEPCCKLSGPCFTNIARWLPVESGEGMVCVGTQQGSVVRWGGVKRGEAGRGDVTGDYRLDWYPDHSQQS